MLLSLWWSKGPELDPTLCTRKERSFRKHNPDPTRRWQSLRNYFVPSVSKTQAVNNLIFSMQFPFKLPISCEWYRYPCYLFLFCPFFCLASQTCYYRQEPVIIYWWDSQDKDSLEKHMISDIQHGLFEWSLVCIKCWLFFLLGGLVTMAVCWPISAEFCSASL